MNSLVRRLERKGGPLLLSWKAKDGQVGSSLELLEGSWRLIYSSAFNSGNLGGRRPGPPAALVPIVLGQIYQDINLQSVRNDMKHEK